MGVDGETPKVFFGRKSSNRRVSIGEDDATPKKMIPSANNRRVNMGLEGQTPKKIVNADGTTKNFNFAKRKVNVGIEGNTPVKTFEYFGNIPVGAAPNKARFESTAPALAKVSRLNTEGEYFPPPPGPTISSARSTSSVENFMRVSPEVGAGGDVPSPTNRPKTSRGKSHPSPDEFFDYVVPSPPPVKSRNGKTVRIPKVPQAAIKRYSADEFDDHQAPRNGHGTGAATAQPLSGGIAGSNGCSGAQSAGPSAVAHHTAEVLEVDRLVNTEDSVTGEAEAETDYSESDDRARARVDGGSGYGGSEDGAVGSDQGDSGFGAGAVDAEEEVYDISGADSEGVAEESWEAHQQRHIHMSGADEHRNKQVRMLACWLFGSALRI